MRYFFHCFITTASRWEEFTLLAAQDLFGFIWYGPYRMGLEALYSLKNIARDQG